MTIKFNSDLEGARVGLGYMFTQNFIKLSAAVYEY